MGLHPAVNQGPKGADKDGMVKVFVWTIYGRFQINS
jgi:hypothetical protein